MSSVSLPLRVGIVGTGYAARQRARSLQSDPRCKLIGFVGHRPESSIAFAAESGVLSCTETELWNAADLVFVCTVNSDHGRLVRQALEHQLHVVVEYPLALDFLEAQSLIALAAKKHRLLHVEHIELISGFHLALRAYLAKTGNIHLVRYSSINAKPPAPGKWTFSETLFGFPLIGALSRISRLVDLVGPVQSISCQNRYLERQGDQFQGCICTAQLQFSSGAFGELTYAKGKGLWQSENRLELTGSGGSLIHSGESLTLINAEGTQSFDPGSRQGLFAQDTQAVLDALIEETPLYTNAKTTLHALAVAVAAERSSLYGRVEEITA
jgi:biliverdin reductase